MIPAVAQGFYGKLPARGDFVCRGLPRRFTEPWDGWLETVLPGLRARMGEAWPETWDAAPPWCFALPAGACGPDAALGLMLPSQDRIGRRFPLAFARLTPGQPDSPGDAGFLAAAARAGRAAAEGEEPEQVARRLEDAAGAPALSPLPAGGTLWWHETARLHLGSLPDAAAFAAMMGAPP